MKAFRDGVMRDERAFEAVEKPKKRKAEVDEDGGSPAKKPKAVSRSSLSTLFCFFCLTPVTGVRMLDRAGYGCRCRPEKVENRSAR